MFPFGVLPELANLLRAQWEQALSLEMATGQPVPTVFHWNDRGRIKRFIQKLSTIGGRKHADGLACRHAFPTTSGERR